MSKGGIEYVKELRGRDLPEEDIKLSIQKERLRLCDKLFQQTPAERSDKDIETLQSLEVAAAYVVLEDPKNSAAINKLKMAQAGKTATGTPTTATVFATEKKSASTADSRVKKANQHKLNN